MFETDTVLNAVRSSFDQTKCCLSVIKIMCIYKLSTLCTLKLQILKQVYIMLKKCQKGTFWINGHNRT